MRDAHPSTPGAASGRRGGPSDEPGQAGPWQDPAPAWRGVLERGFVVFWVVTALAGAFNHTMLEGRLLDDATTLKRFMPHLRYGYVMFDVMPTTVTTYWAAPLDGEPEDAVHVAALNPTWAPLYEHARATINFAMSPRLAYHLCRRDPSWQGMALEARTYHVKPGGVGAGEPVAVDRRECVPREGGEGYRLKRNRQRSWSKTGTLDMGPSGLGGAGDQGRRL